MPFFLSLFQLTFAYKFLYNHDNNSIYVNHNFYVFSNFQAKKVSDHVPIEMTLRTSLRTCASPSLAACKGIEEDIENGTAPSLQYDITDGRIDGEKEKENGTDITDGKIDVDEDKENGTLPWYQIDMIDGRIDLSLWLLIIIIASTAIGSLCFFLCFYCLAVKCCKCCGHRYSAVAV